MEVPYERLNPDTLRAVIEEYVTREGTDHGLRVYSLEEKVQEVLSQLERGEVRIVYDSETETVNLRPTKK